MGLLDELVEEVTALDDETYQAVKDELAESTKNTVWFPTPGPQSDAYFSEADELFYGGSAGGGKSDLAVGLALNEHTKSLILRRVGGDARDLYDRVTQLIGDEGGNKTLMQHNLPGQSISFGGCKHEDDKQRHKGKPYDLYVFDEVSDFTRSQVEFIKTWNRSTMPGQRCRVLFTGNPPTNAEGLWIIDYFGPWLDPSHPNPAKEGELRWFTTGEDDEEIEVDGPGPHPIKKADGTVDMVRARSRTFIRAWLHDNPYLAETDYGANLDSLPAALRAAYRDGRFDLSLEDDLDQVIPTSWIRAAQDRWTRLPPEGFPMDAIGCDIAQGGADNTVLAPRYGGWHAPLVKIPGKLTPKGRDVYAEIVKTRRNSAHVIIDMGGGYGGSVYELCDDTEGMSAHAYKGAEGTNLRDKTNCYSFENQRGYWYWYLRDLLDPDQEGGSPMMLPPGNDLVADLAAPKFVVTKGKGGVPMIKITKKKDVVEALGRSPDEGDAVVMSHASGNKPFIHHKPKNLMGHQRPQMNTGHSSKRRASGRGRRR